MCGFNLVQSVLSLSLRRLRLRLFYIFFLSGGVAVCTEGTFFFDVNIPGLPFDVCGTWWSRYSLKQQQQHPLPSPPTPPHVIDSCKCVCVMPCDFSIKFYHFNASSQGRKGPPLYFLATSTSAQLLRHILRRACRVEWELKTR